MTLFDTMIAWFLFFVACGIVGYTFTGNVKHLVILPAVAVLIPLLCGLGCAVERLALWWRPSYPLCRRGKCKGIDHYWGAGWNEQHQAYVDRCDCGDKYIYLRKERRYMELLPDGSLRPYLRHRRFGRWKPDKT